MRIGAFLSRHCLLALYAGLFVLLAILLKPSPAELVRWVDWRVMFSVAGFLLVVTALEDSGILSAVSYRVVGAVKTYRALLLATVAVIIVLAAVVTNDLALFAVLPIALSVPLRDSERIKLTAFSALASNVGALWSPLGNPEKIMLWQMSGRSFLSFALPTMPFAVISTILLFIFAYLLSRPLPLELPEIPTEYHKRAALKDLLLFFVYLLLLALGLWILAFVLVVLYFAVAYRGVFRHVDYLFILLLFLVFADFGMVFTTDIPIYVASLFDLATRLGTFFASFILTQFLGDIPAAVLLSKISNHYATIGAGTAVGAMFLITSSIANIIAMRMADRKGAYLRYHVYSIPFVAVLLIVAVFLF